MTATTAPPVSTALMQGIAVQEAVLCALEPLLDAVGLWHDLAGADLGAALHADAETRQRASALVTIAADAHTDLFRLVLGTKHRLATLRGGR
jgi:hypothetical protein